MKIALDGMGGDFAPASPVAGAVAALKDYDDFSLVIVGDEKRLHDELAKQKPGPWRERLSIRHASQQIEMTDSPVDAVRKKKDSSMVRAIDMVKQGEAEAVVSAGNTGALVAATTIKWRTLPGIDRPAIASVMPTESGLFMLVDAGANLDPDPEHLVQYGVMGTIYTREVLGLKNPRVGLMNIGSESTKGTDFYKEAHKLLAASGLNFAGNIEGHGLFAHPVEVVVCDGFVGNLVLKASEGLASAIFSWLKRELKKNPLRMSGAFLAQNAFKEIKKKTNTEEYGGMPLLGLNGVCIKAHGNSSPKAIRNAIRVARETLRQKVNPLIIAEMARQAPKPESPQPQQPAPTSAS